MAQQGKSIIQEGWLVIIRDIFWGLALWGLLSLVLPYGALFYIYMALGILASIGLCTVLMIIFFDWVRVRFDR